MPWRLQTWDKCANLQTRKQNVQSCRKYQLKVTSNLLGLSWVGTWGVTVFCAMTLSWSGRCPWGGCCRVFAAGSGKPVEPWNDFELMPAKILTARLSETHVNKTEKDWMLNFLHFHYSRKTACHFGIVTANEDLYCVIAWLQKKPSPLSYIWKKKEWELTWLNSTLKILFVSSDWLDL